MSRAVSPVVKAGLIAIAMLVCGSRVRATDLPGCSQEITRCLSACRAVCMRRIADNDRSTKMPVQSVTADGAPLTS